MIQELHRLARLHGVQTAYYDVAKRRRQASAESLLAVLRAMRVPLVSLDDVPEALRRSRREVLERGLEPVHVAWDGTPGEVSLSLPAHEAAGRLAWRLELETGQAREGGLPLDQAAGLGMAETVGEEFVAQPIVLPDSLPPGYHRLTVEAAGRSFESLVISAPRRAFAPDDRKPSREWGCFLPLYALHSGRSWGAGDFSDLEALNRWVGELGGGVVGTLPMLAAALDEPFDPSPYSPVSRLFWNEFYIDVTRIPELERSPEARRLLESADVTATLDELRRADHVDYRRLMALKRRVLEALASDFFREPSSRLDELARFVAADPKLEDYAVFRAAWEKSRSPWQQWPEGPRDGSLTPADFDERARQYHLYAQWIAAQQMESLSQTAAGVGNGLYLDLPLGVRPDGYDVWRHRAVYVTEASAGAPPDAVFTKGQDWGFCPLHPAAVREDHYLHFRDFIHHHLKFARMLRIDHVMGLHRLYWVPRGMSADRGVYVQYPADELYAVLSLESHRHRAMVVGENLGTVPSYVNQAMNRHQVRRMYVLQYEFQMEGEEALGPVTKGSIASLNTHDMPPFAAWWNGEDLADRRDLGLMDDAEAEQELASREKLKRRLTDWLRQEGWLADDKEQMAAVTAACLKWLAASSAGVVLVNLEDLWQETRPQNVPGTSHERPNWRRKAGHSMEEFQKLPEVVELLQEINRLRRAGGRKSTRTS